MRIMRRVGGRNTCAARYYDKCVHCRARDIVIVAVVTVEWQLCVLTNSYPFAQIRDGDLVGGRGQNVVFRDLDERVTVEECVVNADGEHDKVQPEHDEQVAQVPGELVRPEHRRLAHGHQHFLHPAPVQVARVITGIAGCDVHQAQRAELVQQHSGHHVHVGFGQQKSVSPPRHLLYTQQTVYNIAIKL